MARRRTVVLVVVVAAALAAVAAANLTGLVIFGDPFTGTWRPPDAPGRVVIKRTADGYAYGIVVRVDGQWHSSGRFPGERHGRVLDSVVEPFDEDGKEVRVGKATFEFQSWNCHLVEVDHGLHLVLTKVSSSTSIPPPQTE